MSLNHNISATDLYSIFDLFDSKRSTGEQDIMFAIVITVGFAVLGQDKKK